MYIKIKVTPKAKEESFEKVSDDTFVVKVKEPAERNLANERVIALVREHFHVPLGKATRIISGHHSPHKIISIDL
ncbi:MAG TPA: DUF167 domain-containing protein [Candidatus Paceibacterota bacterium]